MRKTNGLPAKFPAGTKYVLEARGGTIRRHIEFPDGRRMELSPRQAATCNCLAQQTTVVPELDATMATPAPRRQRIRTAA